MTVSLAMNYQTSLGEASGDWISNTENLTGLAFGDSLTGIAATTQSTPAPGTI
ncbi:MAG: hypothetical protein U0936_16450 [Planctomycetaceae bacterium]